MRSSGAVIVLIVVFIAVLGPYAAPYDSASTDMFATWAVPGSKHLLGTDGLGRDILSRILVGARVSLTVVVVVLTITLAAGTALGLIAGYSGGWVDNLIMRFVDIVFAFPELILAILVASIIGPGTLTVIVALSLVYWPGIARMTRALVLALKSELFVEAAVACGTPTYKIMLKHLLPNIIAPLIVRMSVGVGFLIMAEATLSFLGIGIQEPQPTLGRHDPGWIVRTAHRPLPGAVQQRHPGLYDRRLQPAGRRPARYSRPQGARQMSPAVLSVRDLSVSFATLRGKINVIDRLSLEIAPGEILGPGGRVGLRQIRDRAGRHGPSGAQRRHRPGERRPGGEKPDGLQRGRASEGSGGGCRHDFPGTHDQPEPGFHGRFSNRRTARRASGLRQEKGHGRSRAPHGSGWYFRRRGHAPPNIRIKCPVGCASG